MALFVGSAPAPEMNVVPGGTSCTAIGGASFTHSTGGMKKLSAPPAAKTGGRLWTQTSLAPSVSKLHSPSRPAARSVQPLGSDWSASGLPVGS